MPKFYKRDKTKEEIEMLNLHCNTATNFLYMYKTLVDWIEK